MRDDRPPRRAGTLPAKVYEARQRELLRAWAKRNRLRHAIGATLAAAQAKAETGEHR